MCLIVICSHFLDITHGYPKAGFPPSAPHPNPMALVHSFCFLPACSQSATELSPCSVQRLKARNINNQPDGVCVLNRFKPITEKGSIVCLFFPCQSPFPCYSTELIQAVHVCLQLQIKAKTELQFVHRARHSYSPALTREATGGMARERTRKLNLKKPTEGFR